MKKNNKYWWLIDCGFFVYLQVFSIYWAFWPYRAGRRLDFIGDIFYFCFAFLIAGLLFLIFFFRAVLVWPKHIKSVPFTILTFLSACGIFASPLIISNFTEMSSLKGMEDTILRQVNFKIIRDWLSEVDSVERDNEDRFHFFALDKNGKHMELPKPANTWKLSYLTLDKEQNPFPAVNFEWGGPFARWGFVIGPETMEIPKSDPEGTQIRKIADGAYVWINL